MNYNLKICKTDVKIYDINIDIDFADLKSWVDDTQYDYQEFLEMNFFDDDKGEIDESKIDTSEEEFYNQFIDDYIESLDVDVVFTDNCQNHSEYQLESEECQLMEVGAS
jgi:hypothetical protein